jgi:hypothetical protein
MEWQQLCKSFPSSSVTSPNVSQRCKGSTEKDLESVPVVKVANTMAQNPTANSCKTFCTHHKTISFIFLHPSTWILHSFFIASSPITLVINYWFPRFTTWEWTDHSTTMVSQSPLPVWRGWVLQTAESGSLRPHRQLFQQTRSRI